MAENCEKCKFRAKYDQKPNSFLGKFWRWHINFCPGWKAYVTSQSEEKGGAARLPSVLWRVPSRVKGEV